jgi:hypothetical protein
MTTPTKSTNNTSKKCPSHTRFTTLIFPFTSISKVFVYFVSSFIRASGPH